ncbi:MAG: hypothetical protein M8353_04680 [ANME-2 cluster archaeon]|nr:hypothetical protein [ANME-2 cluster archaeon]
MFKKFIILSTFIFLVMVFIGPTYADLPSAEQPAKKADEQITRRLPFTFQCDFCHNPGTATNVKIPHSTSLVYHDKLVLKGQVGCFICHDFDQRSKLRLLSGELISFEDSPRLCYQCHQKRYDTWLYGDHGKSKPELDLITDASQKNLTVEELENRRVRCSDFMCHNPHNPRLYKVGLGIGYPLPPPLDPPEVVNFLDPGNDEPYTQAVIFSGKIFITVLILGLLISLLMILNRNKWRPD